MEYIKLNPNYTKYGHRHGFKFDPYIYGSEGKARAKARAVEEFLRSKYGSDSDRYCSAFFGGKPNESSQYWVTFKGKDSLVSYIMLKVL
jgi:hypothetical protein